MRVARLTGIGAMGVYGEPGPTASPGCSLVRVTAVGLCGSDLHWFSEGGIGDAQLGRPLVLGHEIGGVIVGGPRDGEHVAVDPALPCESCATCRTGHRNLCPDVRFAGHGETDGGLRELMVWPDTHLHGVPDEMTDAGVAVLEPLGVALHAIDLGHVRVGSSVAVVGCGPIGLLAIQVARAAGATSVLAIEPLAHRRQAARASGATAVLDVGEGAEPLADVVIDAVGTAPALALASEAARPGGRVVLVGISDDGMTVVPAGTTRRKGLTLAVARRMGDVYPRALRVVARGLVDLDAVVSDVFPLEDVQQAFIHAVSRRGLKTVIAPAQARPAH
jgi:L-iditol 2-dehydrogenase